MGGMFTNLSKIPQAGIKLGFELLNATSAATNEAMNKLKDRLSAISIKVTLPNIGELINNIGYNLQRLPARLAADIGKSAVDMVESLQNLANTNAPKDLVNNVINSFNDLMDKTTNGIAQLPIGSVNYEQMVKDMNAAVEKMIKDLTTMSQSADAAVADFATKALADTKNLLANIDYSLKNIVDAVAEAGKTAANTFLNAVQGLINGAVTKGADLLKGVTDAVAALIDLKVQAAQKIYNAGAAVVNKVTSSLNSLGLQAKKLKSQLDAAIKSALDMANDTKNVLTDLATSFIADAQKTAENISNNLKNLIAEATKSLQTALESGDAKIKACANDALTKVESGFEDAQEILLNCSYVARSKLEGELNIALDQIQNALDVNSVLYQKASACIEEYQAKNTTLVAATACIVGVSAEAAANTATGAFTTLIASMKTAAQNIINSADGCSNAALDGARTSLAGIMDTFNVCVLAP